MEAIKSARRPNTRPDGLRRCRSTGVHLLILLLLGCASGTSQRLAVPEGIPTAAYVNGRWWDGNRFVERTVYVVGDSFAARIPNRIDLEVDLRGAWVVPPFSEAHNHNFDAPWMLDSVNEQLLREGVFYGLSLTNWADTKQQVLPFWERSETVDVAFADLGLTAAYGHPILKAYASLPMSRPPTISASPWRWA